jgi:AcrR family transcriptional regulator
MTVAKGQGKRTRPGLTVDRIVDAALMLLDEQGLAGLTTTTLTRRLGVSQPAFYSHFESLEDLRTAIAVRGVRELGAIVEAAVDGKTGDEAIDAMAHAYRDYVRAHPDRYLLQLSTPASQEYSDVAERTAEVVRDVLRGYGLDKRQVVEAHVALRAAIHGFVHLEARDALGPSSSAADHFDFFITLFAAGLRSMAPGRARRPARR